MPYLYYLFIFLISCFSLIGTVSAEETSSIEQTLIIVKPDAVANNQIGAILSRFESAGLRIVNLRMVRLSKQDAEQFYAVHREKGFFAELTTYMSSGSIVPAVLEGPNAIARAREVIGATDPTKATPGTIRADFGKSVQRNAVHGSDSLQNAKEEIDFFF